MFLFYVKIYFHVGENIMYIKYNNKDEIKSLYKPFNTNSEGNNSKIYNYDTNLLLKLCNKPLKYDQINLFEKLKNEKLDQVLLTQEYLLINNQFYGYLVKKIDGKSLKKINELYSIKELLTSLIKVEESIKKMSKNGIFTYDIGNTTNIILNEKENKTYLIDLDHYCFSNVDYDSTLQLNLSEFYISIFKLITNCYYYTINHNTELLCNIYFDIKKKTSFKTNIKDYFESIIVDVENVTDREINTVKDLQKALKTK